MKRIVAWILIASAAFAIIAGIALAFTDFDPKGVGSIVFAAFLLALTGWSIGDF